MHFYTIKLIFFTIIINKMSTNKEVVEGDEPISKVSINKYDPFQLKGTIDDEIYYVIDPSHIMSLMFPLVD